MSILSLGHACIKTTSLERTAAFYCEAIGMKRHFDFTRAGKIIGFYLKASNDTFIEVFLAAELENTNLRCLNHFCLESDDLEGLHRRLVDHGYDPGKITMGADRTWQFWLKDPNGLDVEFQQYTAESTQRTGADCAVDW